MSQFVEVGGRKFEYRRATISFIRSISNRGYEKAFGNIGKTFESRLEYFKFWIAWRRFCSTVLVCDSLVWRVGVLPKQLRLSNIPLPEVLAVAQGFFAFLAATQNEVEIQFKSLSDTKTQSR